MDDEVLVRVVHGVADAREEGEPRLDREGAPVAPAVHRLAVHELHGEPRLLVGGEPAVHEARDAGVDERGEDAPLLAEAPLADRIESGAAAHELERDAHAEGAVVALGEVHDAHPATSELAEQPPRADDAAARRRRLVPGGVGLVRVVVLVVLVVLVVRAGERGHRGVEHSRRVLAAAQPAQRGVAQLGVAGAVRLDHAATALGGRVERQVHDALELRPALPRQLRHRRPATRRRRARRRASRAP